MSIAIPVRDGQETLPLTIASIRAQTYTNWELHIVDDGSQDGSALVARKAAQLDDRILVLGDTTRRGVAARLNQSLRLAEGVLFARIDADDVAYPNRLERQVHHLMEHPEVDLLGSAMMSFGYEGQPQGIRVGPVDHGAICARPLAGFKLFAPTWAGRTEWFRAHWWDEAVVRSEDQALLFGAYEASHFANLPEVLVGYREERAKLGPWLVARANYARVVARECWAGRRRGSALLALGEQAAKGATEALSVGFRLERRLLRHRTQSINDAERRAWMAVWDATRSAAIDLSGAAAKLGPHSAYRA